jgi:hypothetical protein
MNQLGIEVIVKKKEIIGLRLSVKGFTIIPLSIILSDTDI